MTTARARKAARWIGLAAGLLAALALVASWRIPADGGTLGADVRFVAVPPGELTVQPKGGFLSARRPEPGGRDSGGELHLRNIGGRRLAVRLVALPSDRALDSLLRVELRSRGRLLARGSLGELRPGSASFALEPRQTATVEARVWLPESVRGHEGLSTDVTVELETREARA